MMKLYKRLSALLLNILIAMMLLPIPVFAAGSIDLNRDVSVTISYQDGKKISCRRGVQNLPGGCGG